jgi:hypothetical protein
MIFLYQQDLNIQSNYHHILTKNYLIYNINEFFIIN